MSGTPPSRRVANSPLYNFIRASSLLEPLVEASRQDSGFSSCPGISDRNTPQLSSDVFTPSPQSSQAQQPKPTVPLAAGGLRLNRMPGSECLDVDLADTMLVNQLSELDTRLSPNTAGYYPGRRFRPLEPPAGAINPMDVLDGLEDDENQSIARSPLVRFDDNNSGEDGGSSGAVQFRFFGSEFIPSSSPSATSAFLNSRSQATSSARLVASSPHFCRFTSTPTGYHALGRQAYAFRPCSAPLNDSSPLEEVEEDTDEDELNASAAIMCGQTTTHGAGVDGAGPICSCSGTTQTGPLLHGPSSSQATVGSAFVASSIQPTFADPRRPHRSIATQTSEEGEEQAHHCYPTAATTASSTILRRPFAMTRSRRPLRTFARPQSAPLNDGDQPEVEKEEGGEERGGGLRGAAVTFGEASRAYGLLHHYRESEEPFFALRGSGSRGRLAASLGEQVGVDPATLHPSVSVYISDDVFAPEEPLTAGPPPGGIQRMPDVVPTSHHDVPEDVPGPRGGAPWGVGGPRPASTPLSELALLRASETEGRGHFRRAVARRRHSFNQENLSIFAQRMADIADALERDHSRYRRRRSWSIQLTGADAPSTDGFTFGRLTRTASSSLLWLSSSMADLVSQPISYLYHWFRPAAVAPPGPRSRPNSALLSRSSRGSWGGGGGDGERSRTFCTEVRPPPPRPLPPSAFPSSFDAVLSGARPGRGPQFPYDQHHHYHHHHPQLQQHPVFAVSPDVLSARSDVYDDNDRTPTQQDSAETAGF